MKICTNPLSAILALSKLNITEVKTLNPKTVGRFPREKLTSHNFKIIFAGDTESVRAVRHPEAGQEGGPGRLLPVRVREAAGQEPPTSGPAPEVRVREAADRPQEEAENCSGILGPRPVPNVPEVN